MLPQPTTGPCKGDLSSLAKFASLSRQSQPQIESSDDTSGIAPHRQSLHD